MKISHFRGGGAREGCIRRGLDGLRACTGMSSHRIAAPKTDNCPTDFNPRCDQPQPYQSKNGGADQDIQDWTEVWVPSWWLEDGFQEMKGDTRNRDSLWTREQIRYPPEYIRSQPDGPLDLHCGKQRTSKAESSVLSPPCASA